METYEFSDYAPSYCTAHAALIRSPKNAAQLLHNLKTKGAEAFPIQLALIDAAYITSRNHILVAIHQALLTNNRSFSAHSENATGQTGAGQVPVPVRGLKTKSIHSEILWNLSISSNIMDSFRTFGLSEETKDVLVVHIADKKSPEPGQILLQIMQVVEGTLDPDGLKALDSWQGGQGLDDKSPVDWVRVCKVYKLESHPDKKQVANLVTSMVAMKSVAA